LATRLLDQHRLRAADGLQLAASLVRLHIERVVAAVNTATPGSYTEVEIPER
jgi:hypothetical protein